MEINFKNLSNGFNEQCYKWIRVVLGADRITLSVEKNQCQIQEQSYKTGIL